MLEANKQDIELSYCELDLFGDNKNTGFETYSKMQKDNGNHEFSTDTEKAALANVRNDLTSKDEESSILPLKTRKLSSSSEGDNRMVATFEEDFDSGDEEIHLEVYSKKLDGLQHEMDNSAYRTPSPRFQSTVQSPKSPKTMEFPPPPPEATTNIDLDSWLESSPDIDNSRIAAAIRLDSSEDEEGEKQNPLVAPIPPDDSDDNDQSNEGSTSGSNMGFTVLSTTMAPLQNSPVEITARKSDETKKQPKKKKSTLETGKKKKKSSSKVSKPASNLLVEDLQSPVDAEQYESL
jgi:hypothetical protein